VISAAKRFVAGGKVGWSEGDGIDTKLSHQRSTFESEKDNDISLKSRGKREPRKARKTRKMKEETDQATMAFVFS